MCGYDTPAVQAVEPTLTADEARAKVADALRAVIIALGHSGCAKILAIKEVRAATHLGLKESKDLVEALCEAVDAGHQARLEEAWRITQERRDEEFARGKCHGRSEAMEGIEEMRTAASRAIDAVGELAAQATRAVGFFEPHQEEMARLARRGLLGLAEDATEELRRVAGFS